MFLVPETRYTPDDYMTTAPPRVMGAECEYDVQFQGDTDKVFQPYHRYINAHTLRAAGLTMGQGDRGFLSNGARLYHELAKFAEFATAEALGPEEATLCDKAGEIALRGTVRAAPQQALAVYRRSGVATRPGVYDTRGYHASFMVPRALGEGALMLLKAHMATRKWAGGGIVTSEGYRMSQKAPGIGSSTPAKSTKEGNKTMFNQYKLMAGTTWHRFEDRCGDPLRSPAAILASFGSTSLLLRLIEHPNLSAILPRDLPADPIAVTRQAGSFDNKPETFRTFGGGKSNWLVTQQLLIDAVTYMADEIPLPEDEIVALQIWQEIIDAYEAIRRDSDDIYRAATLTDAAAKYRYLRRKFDGPLENANPRIVQADMKYDDIMFDAVDRYWQANITKHPLLASAKLSTTDIERYVTQPPSHTTASARAAIVRERKYVMRNWSSYTNNAGLTMQLQIAPIR